MTDFYLLESPGERTYQYAREDASLVGLNTVVCEACRRTVSVWEFREPHCLIVEGGAQYPDWLPFVGAGGSLFVLSERALEVFPDNGITGLADIAPIRVMREQNGELVALPESAPQYLLVQIDGRIELDLGKMFLKRKKLCKSCGSFEWNRQRFRPLFLDEEGWDGSDLCRIGDIPGYIICTERIVKLVREKKLKGFSFKKL